MSLNHLVNSSTSLNNPLNIHVKSINGSDIPTGSKIALISNISPQTDGLITKFDGIANEITATPLIMQNNGLNMGGYPVKNSYGIELGLTNNSAKITQGSDDTELLIKSNSTQNIIFKSLSTELYKNLDCKNNKIFVKDIRTSDNIDTPGSINELNIKAYTTTIASNINDKIFFSGTDINGSNTTTSFAIKHNQPQILSISDGSDINPIICSINDTNTGIYFNSNDKATLISSNSTEKLKIADTRSDYTNNLHYFTGQVQGKYTIYAENINKYCVPTNLYPTIQDAIDAINAEYLGDNTKQYSIFLKNGTFTGTSNIITIKQGCIGICGENKNPKSSVITAKLVINNISGPFSFNNLSISVSALPYCMQISGASTLNLYIDNCEFNSSYMGGMQCISNSSNDVYVFINYTIFNTSAVGDYFINSTNGYWFVSHCKCSLFGGEFGRFTMNNGVFVLDNCTVNGQVILSGCLGGIMNSGIQDITNNHNTQAIRCFGLVPFGLSYNIYNSYLQSDNTGGNDAIDGEATFLIEYNNVTVKGRLLIVGPTASVPAQLS